MKMYCGKGYIDPWFLSFSTEWRQLVSFTSRLLYFQGKSLWYPLDKPQSWSGRRVNEKNLLPLLDCFKPTKLLVMPPIPPTTVAALSKAWTVFAILKTGIVGYIPTWNMDICVQVAALRRADPPSKESCRICNKIKKVNNWPRSNKGL
jgi:hypothetical protein